MARVPSIAELERQLQYARTREAVLATRQKSPPKVGSRGRQPADTFKYQSIWADNFVIDTGRSGVAFFGAAALGLAEPDDSPAAPRGFKPAQIVAVRGKSSPVEKTAFSGRRYLKYTDDAGSANTTSKTTYRAAISDNTTAGLKTKIRNIMRDKKDDVGEYGRIYFEPERPVFRASGTAAAAP